MLLLAAAAMVGTLPGRTQGLGLVTEPLLTDLQIDRVAYAQINLWATLIGAAGALGVGRLIDSFGSRHILTWIALALGLVVCAMSQTTSVPALALWLLLTRAIGQSALSVVSLAMVGQWFTAASTRDGGLQRRDEHRLHDRVPGRRLAGAVVGLAATWLIGVALRRASPLALPARAPASLPLALHVAPRCTRTDPQPDPHRTHDARPGRRPCDAGVLDLLGRRGAVRSGRVRHRSLQRIDPRRTRLPVRRSTTRRSSSPR